MMIGGKSIMMMIGGKSIMMMRGRVGGGEMWKRVEEGMWQCMPRDKCNLQHEVKVSALNESWGCDKRQSGQNFSRLPYGVHVIVRFQQLHHTMSERLRHEAASTRQPYTTQLHAPA